MKDAGEGFILATIMWLLIITLTSYNMDTSFAIIQNKHQRLMELCEKVDSVPKSYDTSHLTCVNGLVIDYTTGEK